MALIKIGTTPLPDPAEYSVTLQDIDSENTRRTEAGILTRDRVRAGVYKIQATWKVNKSELIIITDAVKPAQFAVTFFDPTTSTNPTRPMYVGDRMARLIHLESGQSLWELSLSLIEY
jgi:hypothetical protein